MIIFCCFRLVCFSRSFFFIGPVVVSLFSNLSQYFGSERVRVRVRRARSGFCEFLFLARALVSANTHTNGHTDTLGRFKKKGYDV